MKCGCLDVISWSGGDRAPRKMVRRGGRISASFGFLREYFNPTRTAKAIDTPILGLESVDELEVQIE